MRKPQTFEQMAASFCISSLLYWEDYFRRSLEESMSKSAGGDNHQGQAIDDIAMLNAIDTLRLRLGEIVEWDD